MLKRRRTVADFGHAKDPARFHVDSSQTDASPGGVAKVTVKGRGASLGDHQSVAEPLVALAPPVHKVTVIGKQGKKDVQLDVLIPENPGAHDWHEIGMKVFRIAERPNAMVLAVRVNGEQFLRMAKDFLELIILKLAEIAGLRDRLPSFDEIMSAQPA